MRHKYYIKYFIPTLLTCVGFAVTSCGKTDSPDIPSDDSDIKSTVLLYAVASNNLYGNLIEDKNEILDAAGHMNLSGLRMLVYQVTPKGNPALLELKRINPDSVAFVTVKEYDRSVYSTDPERVSDVISDVRAKYDSDLYGLILWSHGTGWDPTDAEHGTRVAVPATPVMHSFGSDKDSDRDPDYYDEINIDELAEAIPDNFFNFIWFDACYMSGIEIIYQLRDKCRYFVGYPTEVFTPGMPYNLTLPYILSAAPDLAGGAEAFFNYYATHASSSMRVASVAVVDMANIEPVADFCRIAYDSAPVPDSKGLLKYTRRNIGPFYDFGQYTEIMAASGENGIGQDSAELKSLLDDLIVYSAVTPVDFNYNPIDVNNFSGVSCHLYNGDDDSDKSRFYRTLDWYDRVYR